MTHLFASAFKHVGMVQFGHVLTRLLPIRRMPVDEAPRIVFPKAPTSSEGFTLGLPFEKGADQFTYASSPDAVVTGGTLHVSLFALDSPPSYVSASWLVFCGSIDGC